jgi:outer membrane immunogenic protein
MMNAARLGRVLLIALVAIGLSLVSTHRAEAQNVVGGGLKFSTEDALELGIQAGAYVGMQGVLPGLRIGGDVSYYLPTDNFSLLAFNINGQLHFLVQEALSAYGLAGVSIGRWSFDVDDTIPQETSGTETGLNLGGGVEFRMGFGLLYAEAKIVTGDLDRFAIAGGLRFPF